MKTQRFVSSGFARACLFLTIAACFSGQTVLGQSLSPVSSQLSPITVIAGNGSELYVTGLNTSTTLPPATIDFYSEDTNRLFVDVESITQVAVLDGTNGTYSYPSVITGLVAGIQRLLNASPEPIPVYVQAHLPKRSPFWEGIAYYHVLDPTFTYSPSAPAVKVSDTVPISIRRSMARSATLYVNVYSANSAVLGLGLSQGGPYTNASITIAYDVNDPTKTFYASARALAQGVFSTNIVLTAEVGSYRTNVVVLITRNGDLILTPQTLSTEAGDALSMTVTRTSTTNVSPLEVLITTDKPQNLSVPGTVVIPAGEQTVNFSLVGRAPGVANVHITADGVEDNTNSYSQVTVQNPELTFDQDVVTNTVGGTRVITINRMWNRAGGDLDISLVSLAPSCFEVEESAVTIPADHVSMPITVRGLSTGAGFLKISVGSFTTNIEVIVTDPSLTFSPSSVSNVVGDMRTVTVTRPSDENAIDLTLNLSSLSPDVFGLSAETVTIPAGQQSATFEVTGLSAGSGTLVAYVGAYSTNISVTVGAPSVGFLPAAVTSTVGDLRIVTLSRPLSEANADLNLSLSSLAPNVFSLGASSVLIPAGSISATVTVHGLTTGAGFLQARSGSYATNLPVTINDPTITFSPTPTMTNTVGDARTLTISRPSGEAGADLLLSLSSLAPDVFGLSASNVTILAGNISATVTVSGLTSGSGFMETRVGSYATNLAVQVNAPVLAFSPVPLTNTVGDAKTVTVVRPVGESGDSLTVALSSLAPDLFKVEPASITIPAGSMRGEVTVTGLSSGAGILQANAGSYSTNLAVIVGDPTLMFIPDPLTNRVGEIRTVTIRRPVGQSGASLTIQLSTLSAGVFAISVSEVTIAAGQVSVDFLVLGSSNGVGSINASVGSYGTNLQVIVPSTTLGLAAPVAVRIGQSSPMTITRGGGSSSYDLTVTLSDGGSGEFLSVPASETIQGGQTSRAFDVTGLAATTGVEVRASADGYPSARALVPVIPTNPYLQYIVWRDVDASKTYSTGDTVTLTFNSSMATNTVTTANLTLKELNASHAWINSPTGSWGAGSTVTLLDPGSCSKYQVTLAGAPVLGAGLAVDPSNAVTDVLGYPDTTTPPVYLPGAEEDTNTNGIPDWWEELYFGCAACVNAAADPDGDGLVNLWEFNLKADPLDAFSLDTNTPVLVKDGDWDSDGDTLINRLEIDEYGTDPSAADTDDDGWTDGRELDTSIMKADWWRGRRITSPLFSRSPLVQRSMAMTGVPVAIPDEEYLDRAEWMVDLWVKLTNTTSTGTLVCRKTSAGLTNFCLRVDNNVPTIEFQSPSGVKYGVRGVVVPADLWTHLTGSWIPTYKSLELKQNDVTLQATNLVTACAQGRGSATIGDTGLFGYLDKVVIRNPLPVDVVFVLDISGSMTGEPLTALQAAATMAVDLLPQDTPIGIVAFSDDATNLTQGFSTDKVKLKRIISSLVTKNLTDYTKALDCATNLVATSSALDRHLEIFISDGEPNPLTSAPSDEKIQACKNMGIVIDTIGFGYSLTNSAELKKMSIGTDGKYFDAPTAEDLDAALTEILNGLFKTRYLFDDGGVTAEDYERPLSWSNALSAVTFETNTYVETSDVELGDTEPPQWWQTLFFGVNGCDPTADIDKDGLINLYEYYSDTNPQDDDTDGDGIFDGAEDYDSDGLQNQDEQAHSADPRLTDTDDDGITDWAEKTNDTDAAYSLSPYLPKVLLFGGTTNDFLTMPLDLRFKLMNWTLEAWVNPAAGWGGNGSVVYRDSEAGETNFFLGLDANMRPEAGFGRHSVKGPTAVTNDSVTWTHLAATYDSVAQKLTLYVNATQVAVRGCSENPRASGIGPVVQRIGQGFNGMLDEVRIWNVSRSPESIANELNRVLSGNDPGLVAYYRFDDNTRWEALPTPIGTSGNNITNSASAVDPGIHPWTWGQVEDFATAYSKKDWTNRWKNAATINGNVGYSNAPGVTVQYPAIRVILQPTLAVSQGARWSLNNGGWFESGDVGTLTDTNSLSAMIGYQSVYGWTEPSPVTVPLTNGLTRTLVSYYQMNGTLTVYLEPMEARSNGAMWRVDGGEFWPSGMTISNIAPGQHVIDFQSSIDGWPAPDSDTITMHEGEALQRSYYYVQGRGSLTVHIDPEAVRTNGGRWRVDGGSWYDNDTTNVFNTGTHSVEFQSVAGWLAPNMLTNVVVMDNQVVSLTATYREGVQSVSGTIETHSLWENALPLASPPGDGSHAGRVLVGVWSRYGDMVGAPLYRTVVSYTNQLPFGDGSIYSYMLGPLAYLLPPQLGNSIEWYRLMAWIDADGDLEYDVGEPASSNQTFEFYAEMQGAPGVNVAIVDDLDADGLPDWWEVHWFGNLAQTSDNDYDRDGLSNATEYNLAEGNTVLAAMNPANWDSDGDGMDDQWEVEHFAAARGLNATTNDAFADADGDGLSNVQEYNGMDGLPRIEQDIGQGWGIASTNRVSEDDLNPLDVDTDGDGLVDSFEAAWYDVSNGIDPIAATNNVIGIDSDEDGLSNYREQCLLVEFREGESNDIWSHGTNDLPGIDTNGIRAFSPPLSLGATNSSTIKGDLVVLQAQGWTSPGNPDTDDDLLPDGWEVEYNLDPKSAVGANGFWGDPDGDFLLNSQEYLGQDGDRSTNRVYVNGTGDETNPNQHNWRPVTTGPGPGIMRPAVAADYWDQNAASPTNGTLGAALPTASLGFDRGRDTDDDGLADDLEIRQEYSGLGIDPSPVCSMSPFIKRSAMIKRASGVEIPDPEGSPFNCSPLLHRRDWTIECYAKLLGTNLTGYLVDNPGPLGVGDITYRLSLSNNVPIVAFHTANGSYYKVVGPTLPTNRWIHLAGVWDHNDNSLGLYVDGMYFQSPRITEEAFSSRMYASVTPPVIGASANGSFTNRLMMDEIKIWGVARTAAQIEQYRTQLVPQNSVGLLAYYRFDDGGTTAEDFAHKAQNGLLGAVSADYFFGDFGYALPTNGFAFVTNDYAMVLGVDARGADDTDGDGMPDDWEMINHLDPLSTNDLNGATADADGDGLENIYEYWSDTNPREWDTDGDSILDVNEDRDGDGVVNLVEQQLGSRPDMVDTDDDGLTDNEERGAGSNPGDANDPPVSRALEFGGAATDYMEIPISIRQRMANWTIEAWVNPASVADGIGTIVRRVVQNLDGGANAMNFILGVETNASGALQAYAGYVLADGSEYMIHGGELPTGTWTHAAAVYNSANASLTLYTNGYLAASSNGMSSAPPINGKGGDVFVRIGEHFQGQIDEVRLWSIIRSESDIRADFGSTVSELQTNLVHYFRFDDGQAVTNTFPFGPFHQPHNAQDYTYNRDWMNQWKHTGLFHGSVKFFGPPGAIQPPASLRVNLLPIAAVAAGAQWVLNGGVYNNSGDTVGNLSGGTNALLYKSISGWTAPTNEVIVLTNGLATTITRTYLQNGSLTVNIEPVSAVATGAQWRVGGGAWQNSGSTVTNLDIGTYTLNFCPVPGWNPPASWNVVIAEGAHVTEVGQYSQVVATLTVALQPQGVIDAGARWRVDSGPWVPNGATANLDYGPHTVEFLPISPWVTPLSKTVTVSNDAVFSVTGVYTEVTGLYVEIKPAEAVANGAGWRLSGETNYLSSGTLQTLSAGSYTVEFRPLTGWLSPGNRGVVVQTGTTFITATYLRSEVLFTNLVNFLDGPRGLALDSHRRLYIADSGNNRIIAYDTQTGSMTNWGGPTNGTVPGQFYQPQAIAVDGNDNIFVADTHNYRIQRWSSIGSNWTEWTVGVNPWDIALDWRTNLYIAEYYSNRVLKVTPSLVRSTFVSNGFADGLVRSPGGVAVDASNNVVIADFPVNNQGRVQRFGTNGVLISRIGSHLAAEGSLSKPQSLAFGGSSGVLFVSDIGSNCLMRRNGDATWQMVIGGGVVPNAGGLAWDAQGYLYVSDTDSNRVLRISVPELADIPPTILDYTPDITWWGGVGWYYTLQYYDGSTSGPWTDTPGCIDMRGVYRVMRCIDTNSHGIGPVNYRITSH